MYKRLSNFLDKKKLIYSLQFGFDALIHLTETIKQSLGQGLFSCGIFVDLQKAFDTLDHVAHWNMGTTNKWFEAYLKNRQQFFSTNGYNSECASIPAGVPL